MSKIGTVVIAVICTLAIAAAVFLSVTPAGRGVWNSWFHEVQEVDDRTNYDTIKKVEDTCRAMIATYEADRLMYEQYKDSDDEEEQDWAAQAKMRANRTAPTYNNYILENEYVWADNVPNDIYMELPYLT